jgi:hypothetical protein
VASKRRPSPKPAKQSEKKAPTKARLAALIDGKPLDDEEARTLWQAFSAHMDEHEGDLDGFAKKKGWKSVQPQYRAGQAVLVVTT